MNWLTPAITTSPGTSRRTSLRSRSGSTRWPGGLRSAHAAACDAVSDAVAAGYLGDVVSYGRTLARLAVRAARPAPANVLAMARTSDVRRRLDALNRRVFRTPLPWRLVMPALLVGGVLLVLIGGIGFTRAEQAADPAGQAADHPRQQSSGKMTLRAVAAATNQPVEGVSIEYHSRFDGKYQEGKVATGKDGLATIDYPPNSRIESFWIIARKARLVPVAIVWTDQSHPVELPTLKELRFDPGTTIGGIVQDEAGHPIAGAGSTSWVLRPRPSPRTMASRWRPPRPTPRADGDWTSRPAT